MPTTLSRAVPAPLCRTHDDGKHGFNHADVVWTGELPTSPHLTRVHMLVHCTCGAFRMREVVRRGVHTLRSRWISRQWWKEAAR